MSGSLQLFSWADPGKIIDSLNHPPDGSVELVPRRSLSGTTRKPPGVVSDESGIAHVAYLGKLYTVPLAQFMPKNEPFRFEEKQSTFVLAAGRSTEVQYTAPGAVRYDLLLYTLPHTVFYEEPTLELSSTDGKFDIELEMTAQVMTNLSNGALEALGGDDPSYAKRLTPYVKAVTPAYRVLTGRSPRGVPFPVFVIVVAEDAGGKKAALAHCYLIDVPMTEMRKHYGS